MSPCGGRLDYFYGADGTPEGFTYTNNDVTTSNGTYYYVKNLQGDILEIINEAGETVVKYSYDVWGKTSVVKSTSNLILNANPFRYRGYVYDYETGYYYLNSRYYDPETGRFINADSVVDNRGVVTQNLFQYCGNNPINNIDPSGNLFVAVVGVGLIIGAVVFLSGCSSKPTSTPATPSTSSKPSTSSSAFSSNSLTQEQKHFVSVVAGEAIGANTKTQKAVAHTIMNRVNEPRDVWSNAETVTDVLTQVQYNAVGSNQYNMCMSYLNNRDGSNAEYENLISAVIPIYEGVEEDFTCGAHYIFNINGSVGLLKSLESQPERYVKCGPFDGISDTEYRMYRCLW